MSDPVEQNLGVSIKRSTEFIAAIHSQTQMVLVEISGILEKHKFESVRGTSIFVPVRSMNIQSPEAWCHKVVARLFGEGGKSQKSTHLVAVEAHFAPTFGVDEAVVVLGFARLSEGHGREDLQASYEEHGWVATVFENTEFRSDSVQKHAGGTPGWQPFPDLEELRVIAWPLVSFDSSETVKRKVSEGLRKLGAIKA